MKTGTLASDWRVLPKGYKIKFKEQVVEGKEAQEVSGEVHDKGGAIKGKEIDIWVPTHAEGEQKGKLENVSITVTVP